MKPEIFNARNWAIIDGNCSLVKRRNSSGFKITGGDCGFKFALA